MTVCLKKFLEINGEEIYFLKNKKEPFTGKSVSVYINGQKKVETNYKDGKPNGLITYWYENGQKEREGMYRDGEQVGIWNRWHENGQKKGVQFKKRETRWLKNGLV